MFRNDLAQMTGALRLPSKKSLLAFAAYALACLIFLVAYQDTGGFRTAFNGRSDEVYSAPFTFMSVLFGAVLTIWALMKSRATRYIERLHDNVVFQRFVSQLEVRILMAALVLVASFLVYIADIRFDSEPVPNALIILVWFGALLGSIASLVDSMLTARVVLD